MEPVMWQVLDWKFCQTKPPWQSYKITFAISIFYNADIGIQKDRKYAQCHIYSIWSEYKTTRIWTLVHLTLEPEILTITFQITTVKREVASLLYFNSLSANLKTSLGDKCLCKIRMMTKGWNDYNEPLQVSNPFLYLLYVLLPYIIGITPNIYYSFKISLSPHLPLLLLLNILVFFIETWRPPRWESLNDLNRSWKFKLI